MKNIILNQTYSLDLGCTAPVAVKPIVFLKEGILCEYMISTSKRLEVLGYELFEKNGYTVLNESTELKTISLPTKEHIAELITTRLKYFMKMKYNRRISNATALDMCNKSFVCDSCGRKMAMKISYEADYPNNPDIGLCIQCGDELHDLYNNKQ